MKATQLCLDDPVTKLSVGPFREAQPFSRLDGLLGREELARSWFRASGVTVSDWARERGFSVELTRMVLAGKRKCLRGQSYEIAVAHQVASQSPKEQG